MADFNINDLTPGSWQDIGDLQLANADSGRHFFSADTLSYFRSVIYRGFYAGRLFVTSERGPNRRRMYTIRVANDDASIDTLGDFQQYATMEHAKAAARRYAQELLNR